MGLGTARGGRCTCNADIQIGSNPIGSTIYISLDYYYEASRPSFVCTSSGA